MPPKELTMIVAATKSMGIGLKGQLPWQGLKKEMAYFRRVTNRVGVSDVRLYLDKLFPYTSMSVLQIYTPYKKLTQNQPPLKNAVIMGRKTWDSIPPNYRPLKGRVNVVLSRSYPSTPSPSLNDIKDDGPVHINSISNAIQALQESRSSSCIDKVFVIGGAQIYKAVVDMPETKRLLITRIQKDFECDAFLDVDLEGGVWRKCGKEELDKWTGETVPEGVQVENGVGYVFEMWERS